jgi:hypothetical protein
VKKQFEENLNVKAKGKDSGKTLFLVPKRRERFNFKPSNGFYLNTLFYERKQLGNTICGIPAYYLTITSSRKCGLPFSKRKFIFISARVHPGETNSNVILHGFLKFLLSKD